MKYIYCLLFLLSFLNTDFAQSGMPDDTEILDALDDVYNLRFDEAENKFKQFQKTNPDDLKGYFYESLLYFFRALPSRNENMFEKYSVLSENVIERAETILDKNENNYDALYYKGMSHSYRSLLMLSLDKNLISAASNGNEGYRILSGLIEMKPDYYDAYMGLGLYKIAIGLVPGKFQWLLSLIGFDGNLKEGIQYLNISLQKGKYTRVESKVCLSIFSIKEKEDDNRQSLNYSRELTEEYPQSAFFKVLYSGLLLQYGSVNEAIDEAGKALSYNKYSLQDEIKKSASAVMGIANFRLNEYQNAIPFLEEFMKYVNPEDRYNVYLFTLGVSYELTGNRSTALEKYKSVRNNFIEERDGELDKFFYRLARKMIKQPLRDIDIQLIKAMNLRESNHINEAVELYNEMVSSNIINKYDSDDDRSRFYYDAGVAYEYSKDFDKAREYFIRCTRLDPDEEKWIVPHSYFELGKIYNRKGEKIKSEEMFDMISDYSDFDFESFLEMRLANYRNK